MLFHAASAHPKSGGAWTQLTMETAERADGTLAREIAAPGEKAADAREKTDIICAPRNGESRAEEFRQGSQANELGQGRNRNVPRQREGCVPRYAPPSAALHRAT